MTWNWNGKRQYARKQGGRESSALSAKPERDKSNRCGGQECGVEANEINETIYGLLFMTNRNISWVRVYDDRIKEINGLEGQGRPRRTMILAPSVDRCPYPLE
jgi:hypothetical protein